MATENNKKKATVKRPSGEDIKGLLLAGNFGMPSDEPLPMTDPISLTHMVLKLNEVNPCDKDPRHEKNPLYDEIKDSIRSLKKLTHFPNITRRPGDEKYQIRSGGNTRLKIMNELYIETGDEAYNRFDCFFIPWTSDSNLISEHLIENVMRGEMMLIDKAYAIHELKHDLEVERDELISDKKFTQISKEIGYKLSRTHLIRFNYAIKLDQMIPNVLRSGIGGNKLEYIKKVENAYALYCKGKTEQFDPVFMEVMMENDSPESWDIDSVRRDIDERLAELISTRARLINTEVDAILFDQSNARNQNNEGLEQSRSYQPFVGEQPNTTQTSSLIDDNHEQQQNQNQIEQYETIPTQNGSELISPATSDETSVIQTQNSAKKALSAGSTGVQSEPQNKAIQLKILREKSQNLAIKIARPADLEESIIPVKTGLGFFVESPTKPLSEYDNAYFTWWWLFGISEQNTSDESHYAMWDYSNLYSRLALNQQNNDGSLEKWIHVDPGVVNIMHEFLHNHELMNDKVFNSVFQLMENCRAIRHNFSQRDIWENQK